MSPAWREREREREREQRDLRSYRANGIATSSAGMQGLCVWVWGMGAGGCAYLRFSATLQIQKLCTRSVEFPT
jgi:hypothetical protein